MAKLTREAAQKILSNTSAEKRFFCKDGQVMKNLTELEAALKEMNDETFRYHANEKKNDFSNWVKDVIGDDDLAKELRKCSTRARAAKVVSSRIATLKKVK